MNDFAHSNLISDADSPPDPNPDLLRESDELRAVIKTAIRGDNEAFTRIYTHYFDRVYKFIFYRTSHRETAEDLTEEVFVKAYRNITGLKEALAFEGWLFQIARNKVIDHYRSKRIDVDITELENVLEYEKNIVDDVNLQFEQQLFLKVLPELSDEQQQVIKMKFLEDLDNDIIAATLGKTEGAIRVIQHRAIAKLRDLIYNLTNKNTT